MITDQEWLAFMDDLQQTLDKFGVPQPEQDEVKAIVESTREAIVIAPWRKVRCEQRRCYFRLFPYKRPIARVLAASAFDPRDIQEAQMPCPIHA
jgi:hypothetical protein